MNIAIDYGIVRQQRRFDMEKITRAKEMVDRMRQFRAALKHLDGGRWFKIGWRQISLSKTGNV